MGQKIWVWWVIHWDAATNPHQFNIQPVQHFMSSKTEENGLEDIYKTEGGREKKRTRRVVPERSRYASKHTVLDSWEVFRLYLWPDPRVGGHEVVSASPNSNHRVHMSKNESELFLAKLHFPSGKYPVLCRTIASWRGITHLPGGRYAGFSSYSVNAGQVIFYIF